jgi:hypothetical protein
VSSFAGSAGSVSAGFGGPGGPGGGAGEGAPSYPVNEPPGASSATFIVRAGDLGQAGSPGTSGQDGTASATIPAAPASLTPLTGTTPQSAEVGTDFPVALAVLVTDAAGDPLPGAQVTFSAPSSGPSGTFTATGTAIEVVTSDGQGVATASAFAANVTAGTYEVTATSGALSATFDLTNTPTPPSDTDLAIGTVADITTPATSPGGATVTYTPATATDEDGAAPTVTCDPPPGSLFPMGTTTVTCSASDPDDTPSSVSSAFVVVVQGAATQLIDLAAAVTTVGPGTSLLDKISAAEQYLASGDTSDSCGTLGAFLHEVNAQSGKEISTAQAAELISDAQRIRAVLAC